MQEEDHEPLGARAPATAGRAHWTYQAGGGVVSDAELLFELRPQPWMTEGNCAGVDPELFFPQRGESSEDAKAVCRGCLVRAECLDYALSINERNGIWGGTSERERRAIRRQWAGHRRRRAPNAPRGEASRLAADEADVDDTAVSA
jgi:WhiB family redox-sensing transcriptional regulator